MKLELSIILAFILWFFAFRIDILNFWIRLVISASILLLIALTSFKKIEYKLSWLKIILGFLSGFLYYGLLYLGFISFKSLAYSGASDVYSLRVGIPLTLIAIFLIITSIAEETYWRGYVQKNFYKRIGKNRSILLTSAIYGAIHISSLNPPLIFIALVMGIAWGYLYYFTNSLISVILSHIVWTELVFVFLPLI